MPSDREDPRFFPPQVALYLVKIACERPDIMERSLSLRGLYRISTSINDSKNRG
jgi:hypothetical protein